MGEGVEMRVNGSLEDKADNERKMVWCNEIWRWGVLSIVLQVTDSLYILLYRI